MANISVNEIRSRAHYFQEIQGEVISMLLEKIKEESSPDGNMDIVSAYANHVRIIREDMHSSGPSSDHLVAATTDMGWEDDSRTMTSTDGLRSIEVEVSQGMINQNLLTLTDAKKQRLVRDGEQFQITLPDGTNFETELCQPGNKLRERGIIRQFYADNEVNDGDRISLKETKRGHWTLSPKETPEEKESSINLLRSVV